MSAESGFDQTGRRPSIIERSLHAARVPVNIIRNLGGLLKDHLETVDRNLDPPELHELPVTDEKRALYRTMSLTRAGLGSGAAGSFGEVIVPDLASSARSQAFERARLDSLSPEDYDAELTRFILGNQEKRH